MNATSTYRYELTTLDASIDALRSMLPASELLYSVKANPHPEVLRRSVEKGLSIEVSSHGELALAIASGAVPRDIVCTGPGKSDEYLKLACDSGSCVSVESMDEIDRLNALYAATPARLLLRINASRRSSKARLQMTGVASQFGVDEEQAHDAVKTIHHGPHSFVGVHLYMGSNVDEEDALFEQFQIGIELAASFETYATDRFTVDLGGGFGHPFARPGERPMWPGLRERLQEVLGAHENWNVAFESGRYIASACGTLTMHVREVKWSKGIRFAIASSGVNHLGGLAGLRRIPPVRAQAAADAGFDTTETTRLAGPLCTPVDMLNPLFDGACDVGDEIVIPNVGAYGLNASLANFLGHPYPVEQVTDGGEIVSTTRLTTIREEVTP
ncbi:type III PLP-dependent enzyme [Actinoplanes philippinensis]|uniref:type III PLP-dependent enzyme n=1 Tax=Actinoplanes philippinensis TaxID=35752 RepID=UPI0034031BFA